MTGRICSYCGALLKIKITNSMLTFSCSECGESWDANVKEHNSNNLSLKTILDLHLSPLSNKTLQAFNTVSESLLKAVGTINVITNQQKSQLAVNWGEIVDSLQIEAEQPIPERVHLGTRTISVEIPTYAGYSYSSSNSASSTTPIR